MFNFHTTHHSDQKSEGINAALVDDDLEIRVCMTTTPIGYATACIIKNSYTGETLGGCVESWVWAEQPQPLSSVF